MNKKFGSFWGVSAADKSSETKRAANDVGIDSMACAAERLPEPPSTISMAAEERIRDRPPDVMELEQHCRVEAAHQLPFHDGKCVQLHGHSYDIRIKIKYSANWIPAHAVIIDFGKIKDVCEQFDHTYLNTHKLFEGRAPTVENFAAIIVEELKTYIDFHTDARPHAISVSIREGLGAHWAHLSKHYH